MSSQDRLFCRRLTLDLLQRGAPQGRGRPGRPGSRGPRCRPPSRSTRGRQCSARTPRGWSSAAGRPREATPGPAWQDRRGCSLPSRPRPARCCTAPDQDHGERQDHRVERSDQDAENACDVAVGLHHCRRDARAGGVMPMSANATHRPMISRPSSHGSRVRVDMRMSRTVNLTLVSSRVVLGDAGHMPFSARCERVTRRSRMP